MRITTTDGRVIFECFESRSFKELVEKAIKQSVSPRYTILFEVNTRNANFSHADFSDGDLRDARLFDVDFRNANFSDTDLSGADVRDSNCRGANFRGAKMRGADFSGSDMRDADLRDVDLGGNGKNHTDFSHVDLRGAIIDVGMPIPRIENIHRAVYEAASRKDAFDMTVWHSSCGTTHCRAGWVVVLAGDAGQALEEKIGTSAAAALIYAASDPTLERIPNFYATGEEALADMKRLAGL